MRSYGEEYNRDTVSLQASAPRFLWRYVEDTAGSYGWQRSQDVRDE